MAARAQPIATWRRPGPIAPIGLGLAAGLLGLAGAAMISLLLIAGDSGPSLDGHGIGRIAVFTALQAALSAALALALALPTARACWRRGKSWRTDWLLVFCFLPVVMPTTVAATGLIGVWGQKGFVSILLENFGVSGMPPIYGLQAVLLAHVFFNAPLMLRVLTGALAGVPQAQWRLAAQWGLSGWQRFRLIEWPAMRRVIPGLLALVFLICFTSFSLVLMLGGGPAVTTLEVSIYTALRFDFDMQKAATLAILQILICGTVVIILTRLGGRSWAATSRGSEDGRVLRGDETLATRGMDAGILLVFCMIAVAPLLAVVVRGVGPHLVEVAGWPAFQRSMTTSLSIAIISGTVTTALALVLAISRTRRVAAGMPVWHLELSVSLYLAVSAIVLGTGLFIMLRPFADVFLLAPFLVLLGNILVSLPFAFRVLEGRVAALASAHDRLCAGLGIMGWQRFRLVTLPALLPDIGFAAGLASALSIGDMTIIALFGSQQFQTLPWLLYQTMARYRAGEAAALSLWLLGLTLLLFFSFTVASRLFRGRQHA